jgi:hypothetical protein
VALYNEGSSDLVISQLAVTGTAFSVSGLSLPLTFAASRNLAFNVIFAPKVAGNFTGNLSIGSSAADSPVSEPLSGIGVHAVFLSWDGVPSPNIAGYNVYRGLMSRGPYARLNSEVISGNTYLDYAVDAGTTYYYVTTAVNSSTAESGYSNEVQAFVPLL